MNAEQKALIARLEDVAICLSSDMEIEYRRESDMVRNAIAEIQRLAEENERLKDKPSIEKIRNAIEGTEIEGSDNLAIILCSYFEDDAPYEEEVDDEYGWKPSAVENYKTLIDVASKNVAALFPSGGDAP